jgi:hypothetical protein
MLCTAAYSALISANGTGVALCCTIRKVEEFVRAGRIEEVARYCESDVSNTYRIWLIYELFRGASTDKQLEWSERQIRDFVVARKSSNPHLCASIGIAKGVDPTSSSYCNEPGHQSSQSNHQPGSDMSSAES